MNVSMNAMTGRNGRWNPVRFGTVYSLALFLASVVSIIANAFTSPGKALAVPLLVVLAALSILLSVSWGVIARAYAFDSILEIFRNHEKAARSVCLVIETVFFLSYVMAYIGLGGGGAIGGTVGFVLFSLLSFVFSVISTVVAFALRTFSKLSSHKRLVEADVIEVSKDSTGV